MQIHQEIDVFSYSIRGYEEGVIIVNTPIQQSLADATGEPSSDVPRITQQRLRHSFVIAQDTLVTDWPPRALEELSAGHVAVLAELRPEVVIIGTGARLQHPSRAILAPLITRNIGYEIMDNTAACRTYNILTFEGRRTAAGFIMEGLA